MSVFRSGGCNDSKGDLHDLGATLESTGVMHKVVLKNLLMEFADGAELDELADEDQEWLGLRQVECEEFIKSGFVDTLERY